MSYLSGWDPTTPHPENRCMIQAKMIQMQNLELMMIAFVKFLTELTLALWEAVWMRLG